MKIKDHRDWVRYFLVVIALCAILVLIRYSNTATMSEYSACFVTVPSKDLATKIADVLVEKKIAACVNIIPSIQSVYSWEGKIEHDDELLLMIKTQTTLIKELVETVKTLHSYSVPEVIQLDIVDGNPDYLQWIKAVTRTKQ